jgi:hypothetical protein
MQLALREVPQKFVAPGFECPTAAKGAAAHCYETRTRFQGKFRANRHMLNRRGVPQKPQLP